MPSNFTRQFPQCIAVKKWLFLDANASVKARFLLTGVTKDPATGLPIAGVTLEVYETVVNDLNQEPKGRLVNMATSDANGNYAIEVHSKPGATFKIDAYKDGVTPLAGTTVNTLTPTLIL